MSKKQCRIFRIVLSLRFLREIKDRKESEVNSVKKSSKTRSLFLQKIHYFFRQINGFTKELISRKFLSVIAFWSIFSQRTMEHLNMEFLFWEAAEFWFLCIFALFWRLNLTKVSQFKASILLKTAILDLPDSPKLISRKIWVTENPDYHQN